MALLQQSAAYTRTFIMILSSDHVSPATGKTVTVALSKAGGAFAGAAGAVTEIANGWYNVALTAADTGTVGDLSIHCTAAACDNTDFADQVVPWNPLDGVRLGLTALPNATAGSNTGLPVVGTQVPNATAGAVGGLPTVDATNSVKIQTPVKKNTALSNFTFVMLNTSGNPQTGLTVSPTRSIDGAAFAACANSVTELANGWYTINLAAADLNGTNIALRFTAAAARDTNILLEMLP